MIAGRVGPRAIDPLLIDIKALGTMLSRSESSIRRDDAHGRIPRPIVLGGSKRWNRAVIEAWVDAGCPDRQTWEKMSGYRRSKKTG